MFKVAGEEGMKLPDDDDETIVGEVEGEGNAERTYFVESNEGLLVVSCCCCWLRTDSKDECKVSLGDCCANTTEGAESCSFVFEEMVEMAKDIAPPGLLGFDGEVVDFCYLYQKFIIKMVTIYFSTFFTN